MDCSKFFLKFSRSSTNGRSGGECQRSQTPHWAHPRTIYQVKKFGIDQILIPPSEKFFDGCAAVEDLALDREYEDNGFGQFGDK